MDESVRRALHVLRDVQRTVADSDTLDPVVRGAATEMPTPPSIRRPPVDVFISWAHTHPSWTKAQTTAWETDVATFAARLRRLGIRADVDLFHLDEPKDWTRFGPAQVRAARFTLVVMSQAWAERWSGTNSPHEGAGAAAEADTLKGLFAQDQEAWQRRVVLIMFPDVGSDVVPPDLQRVARVPVDPTEPDSFEALIRMLTEQPRYPKPPVGTVPVFGPERIYDESSSLMALQKQLAEIERRMQELGGTRTVAAEAERRKLELSESATRGFIDAELSTES